MSYCGTGLKAKGTFHQPTELMEFFVFKNTFRLCIVLTFHYILVKYYQGIILQYENNTLFVVY